MADLSGDYISGEYFSSESALRENTVKYKESHGTNIVCSLI